MAELISLQFDSVFDILAIVLDRSIHCLAENDNSDLKAATVQMFESLPLGSLLGMCKTPMALSALYDIGKHALAPNFLELSEVCQQELVTGSTVSTVQRSMLNCLFHWGLGEQVG
jgi:hypothetical protein